MHTDGLLFVSSCRCRTLVEKSGAQNDEIFFSLSFHSAPPLHSEMLNVLAFFHNADCATHCFWCSRAFSLSSRFSSHWIECKHLTTLSCTLFWCSSHRYGKLLHFALFSIQKSFCKNREKSRIQILEKMPSCSCWTMMECSLVGINGWEKFKFV